MPPKKLSHGDRAAKLQQKALQLAQQGDFDDIIRSLKARPDLIPSVKSQLTQVGGMNSDTGLAKASDSAAGAAAAAAAAAAAEGPQLAAIQDKVGGDGAKKEEEEEEEEEVGSSCYTFSGMPIKSLVRVLAALGPISMSPFATKAIVERGKKSCNKQSLLQLLEFATGLDPNTGITGQTRKFTKLVFELQVMNQQRGRLAERMALPPDWENHGCYSWRGEEGKLTNMQLDVPIMIMDHLTGSPELYIIKDNFSQARASLTNVSNTADRQLCVCFFPRQAPCKPTVPLHAAAQPWLVHTAPDGFM